MKRVHIKRKIFFIGVLLNLLIFEKDKFLLRNSMIQQCSSLPRSNISLLLFPHKSDEFAFLKYTHTH